MSHLKSSPRHFVSPRLSLERLRRLLKETKLTTTDLVGYCHSLAVAGDRVANWNVFAHLEARDSVLRLAEEAQQRIRDGDARPLEGIPVTIKANLAVSSVPLTAGSSILKSKEPCGYNAEVVQQLRHHGAIIMGITNMDEFGMGSLGTNVRGSKGRNKPTRNPINLLASTSEHTLSNEELVDLIQRPYDQILEEHESLGDGERQKSLSAGGSSCGSAVSVLHGSGLISLGSDTGGSIRLPAAWCGVVGLKPSYGVLSRHGLVSYASSLDTVGILAPSVACASYALECLTKRDEQSTAEFRDSTQVRAYSYTDRESPESFSTMRIGIPTAFSVDETPQSVLDAWNSALDQLSRKGADIQEVTTVSPDLIQTSLAAYYVLACAEASSNLSRYDGLRYGAADPNPKLDPAHETCTLLEQQYAATRTQGFGSEVLRRILCGTYVLSSDRFHTFYESAAKVRGELAKQLNDCLSNQVDVLLMPTALSPHPPVLNADVDPTVVMGNDVMTVPISLSGLPAISVPVADGMGMQVVGGGLQEEKIVQVSKAIQQCIQL